jgi:hypothetical protein
MYACEDTRKIINYFQPERKTVRSQKYTYFRSPDSPVKESHLGFVPQTLWRKNLTWDFSPKLFGERISLGICPPNPLGKESHLGFLSQTLWETNPTCGRILKNIYKKTNSLITKNFNHGKIYYSKV